MKIKEFKNIINGIEYTAKFTDLANQADGSVLIEANDTIILATAVVSKTGKNNPGYFNLTVEYQEKFYADGKILGGQYNKREGRPSENAILSGRIIDRTLRPLFNQNIKNAIQISVSVLALGNADPRILGVLGASLAIEHSGIPWNGPISAVNLTKKTKASELLVNFYDKTEENEKNEITDYLKIFICGDGQNINMIEAEADICEDDTIKEVVAKSTVPLANLTNWQKEISKEIGKQKINLEIKEINEEIVKLADEFLVPKKGDLFNPDSKGAISLLLTNWLEFLAEKITDQEDLKEQGENIFNSFCDEVYHEQALQEKRRPDGRKLDEVREIYAQAGDFAKLLHGTGIFYRGETHILSVLTLGGPGDRQTIEDIENKLERRFMHHYNFPPFSTGDIGRFEGANRRAIGHGALGEKAIRPILPKVNDFPYTIRIVSEALSSNGSTSQASICAASLALMDGGVPIKNHIAGISIGCMIDYKNPSNYCLLTDIQGPEDHHGDMDFKVAGTKDGITAIQLDVKVTGVSPELLQNALTEAKNARLHILEKMNIAINKPREDISEFAPRIDIIKIPVDKIGMVIGGGGKTIKEIMEKSGAEITIEDDGRVYLTGKKDSVQIAKKTIEGMVKVWEVGEKGNGEILKILPGIGAIVKLSDFTDGLIHISELAPHRVENVEDLVHPGMIVPFTIIKIEPEKNRISLSIKKDNPTFFSNK